MIDVAIIGSGIIGLACARGLAKTGRSVAVFDPAPERAAAGVAAGMLSPWSEHPDDAAALEMRERALSLYPEWIASITEETGARPDSAICGTVILDDADGSVQARLRPIMDRAGARTITPAGIRAMAPEVSEEASSRGGVHIPTEGHVDPRTLIAALRAPRAYRIEFRAEAVRAFAIESGRVRGVVTATGETRARHVVNATGGWAALLLPESKVRPVRGEIVVLRSPREPVGLSCVIRSGHTYIVPRRDGSVVVGGTSADVGFDARATAGGIEGILRAALAIVPALQEWSVEEVRAGLRPFRDGGPWIGRDPERDGLVHAVGLNRHGILLAPVAAERVVQEIKG